MSRERYAGCCRASKTICSALNPNSALLRRALCELRAAVFAAKPEQKPKPGIRKAMLVRPHAHHTVFVSSISPSELRRQKSPAENCAGSRQSQRPRLTHVVGEHAFKELRGSFQCSHGTFTQAVPPVKQKQQLSH